MKKILISTDLKPHNSSLWVSARWNWKRLKFDEFLWSYWRVSSEQVWTCVALYKRARPLSTRVTLYLGDLKYPQIPESRQTEFLTPGVTEFVERSGWDNGKGEGKPEIEDREKHSSSIQTGLSLRLHSRCKANSRTISQQCASQGKGVNRAAQSLANAE